MPTFQILRDTLKASQSIREMDISKEHLIKTYCWNNTLLHSAIRRAKEDQDDVNLGNVKVLLEKAKGYNELDTMLRLQMRWEGDNESVQTNRFNKVDNNLLLMSPLTFAIHEGKEKAVEEILSADKKIAYKILLRDVLENISSTHLKQGKFYNKISEFVNSRSSDPEIETLKETLIFINASHQTLLHFVVNRKCTKAFKAILENMDEEAVFKEAFITKLQHRIFYQRTPLELCIYHYNQCSDYQSKSAEDKKMTKDVKEVLDSSAPNTKGFWNYTKDEDFKIAKEFIETILNSARDNGILEDVLTASGIRKDLAKKLSDEKYSNDDIINVLQKNQKAEERGTITGVVIALAGFILAAALASWIIAVAAVFISLAVGYGIYKFSQPSAKMLETDANQEVGSETPCKA